MRPTIDLSFECVLIGEQVPDAGFYAWDIPDNILYADSALAALFGLDAGLAERGLPIENYLERVHPDDRPRLAKTIRDSIIGHHPQQEVQTGMSVSSFPRPTICKASPIDRDRARVIEVSVSRQQGLAFFGMQELQLSAQLV